MASTLEEAVDPALAKPLPERSEAAKLLLFGVMAFGQFMALLDIQIVASSLNSIQAGLSAGPDEIAWVQTAYLMAEIVMIPLAAFLSQAISTRWLFTASAALVRAVGPEWPPHLRFPRWPIPPAGRANQAAATGRSGAP